jgi:hypothetical protein
MGILRIESILVGASEEKVGGKQDGRGKSERSEANRAKRQEWVG